MSHLRYSTVTFLALVALVALPALAEDRRTLSFQACVDYPGLQYTMVYPNGTMQGHTNTTTDSKLCQPLEQPYSDEAASEIPPVYPVTIGSIEVPAAKDSLVKFSVEMGLYNETEPFSKTTCFLAVEDWPADRQFTVWPYARQPENPYHDNSRILVEDNRDDTGPIANYDIGEFTLACVEKVKVGIPAQA